MIKESTESKQANEFEKLAKESITEKEREELIKEFQAKANEMESAVEILGVISNTRHSFLMSSFDLQKIVMEYNKYRVPNIDNWSAGNKKTYRKEVTKFHNDIKGVYYKQHKLSIKLIEYHKNLEIKLGYKFEVSANNPYMIGYIATKCIEYDKIKPN